MNQQTIRNWIDRLADLWGGDVPTPVAPGENVEHEPTPPDAPGDAGKA
jgi:hypothetical protein